MENKGSGKKRIVLIIFMLAAFVILFMLFGKYKEYLYVDEVLSYTAANSTEGMRPSLPVNHIVNGAEFVKKAVTVSKDARFDFLNAIENTSKDPHPPLYLILLHFISSLFPETFSKWFALLINLIAGAVTVVFLYLSSELFFRKEERSMQEAFAVSYIYIFSLGFTEQLMNLRMYVLLQAFTTILTFQYLKCFKDNEEGKETFGKKKCILLILNVLAGTMTHYYFLIFAFFEALFFTLFLIFKREWRSLILHTLSYALAGVLTVLLFPALIWQLTSSDVGSESFAGRTIPELFQRVRVMLSHLNAEIFGGELIFFILFFFAMILLMAVSMKKEGEKIRFELRGLTEPLFILFTALAYFLTVSCTTPYLTGRYLSPSYPLIVLLTLYLMIPAIRFLFKEERAGLVILMLIMAIPLYSKIRAGLFDVNKDAMKQLSKEHGQDICLFFTGITAEENYFELENYERLMAVRLKPKDTDEEGDIGAVSKEKEVIVYVPSDKDAEPYLERVRSINPGLTKAERLYKAYYSDAYVMRE